MKSQALAIAAVASTLLFSNSALSQEEEVAKSIVVSEYPELTNYTDKKAVQRFIYENYQVLSPEAVTVLQSLISDKADSTRLVIKPSKSFMESALLQSDQPTD